MIKRIKGFCFGLWAAFWVALDELGKNIGDMSFKEFTKFIGKIFLYGIAVIGWLCIFFLLCVVGCAII